MNELTAYMGKPPSEKRLNGRQRFQPWFDDLIDWILSNPGVSVSVYATLVNRHPATLGQIMASDVFRNRLAERRIAMNNDLSQQITGETAGVALEALRVLHKRVRDNPAAIPTGMLGKLATDVLDRLGYGTKPLQGVIAAAPTQVNVTVAVNPSVLKEAQQAMKEVQTINATANAEEKMLPELRQARIEELRNLLPNG